MKKITAFGHPSRTIEALCALLAGWRAFTLLSAFTFAAFVAAGLTAAALRAQAPDWPVGGAAAALPDGVIAQAARMELPSFGTNRGGGIDGRRTAAFLFRFATGINPHQPRSLLASELPGLETGRAVLLRPGSVGDHVTGPEDRPPLPAVGTGASDRDGSIDAPRGPGRPGGAGPAGGEGGSDPAAGGGTAGPDAGNGGPGDGADPGTEGDKPGAGGENGDEPETPGRVKRKVVLIYHSHNRESWLPELGEGAKNPESDEINITLVGKRLAERLEEAGIGAVHAAVDYATAVEDYRWELSYKYSKETVLEAMAAHESLTYLFDIHRDSQPRGYTTVTIDGKDYAQVYFVIGKKNPDWQRNEAFAAELHRLLEKRYPGISRGIWGKDAAKGNGEYNQSLSPNSVLIEIGGIENTLEECYRTADALAEVIAELYRSAVETGAVPE
ncbi:MAG: hypothetical protein A9Z00_06480 [Thermobacillus sp. ZCTH02-B1]|uniref:stage II sporulation protein P n=1 Tax=Thermobacillus sp. ZCTH02-B1 TaxID=1858795 RepID=UPI000B56D1EA|nr:stage II sporulation protein P [Thermobacillus sp. ZCTH02-B1]OUM96000.1 MAG: hypothetical protein A9Z00_06480 [Thermobacillus sp. ZCTH02-B1]